MYSCREMQWIETSRLTFEMQSRNSGSGPKQSRASSGGMWQQHSTTSGSFFFLTICTTSLKCSFSRYGRIRVSDLKEFEKHDASYNGTQTSHIAARHLIARPQLLDRAKCTDATFFGGKTLFFRPLFFSYLFGDIRPKVKTMLC